MQEGGGRLETGKEAAAVYKTEKATLYYADFLEIAGSMEDNSVDMVFTDPPFELAGGGMKNGKLNYEGGEIFRNYGFSTKNIPFTEWIPEIYRILKSRRYFYVMTNDRNIFSIHKACVDCNFKFCELLVLDKK